MKKTLTINLNSRVFNIDEDAYQLLDNYLKNLRIYFCKEEGCEEIVADFEARIEELFSNRIRLGYNVIDIEEVERVIAQMGQPDDFGGEEPLTDKESQTDTSYTSTRKKLFRNPNDKMLGGVFSGIAAYFDWNVLIVRLIGVILIFATSFWIVPIYLIAWLIIPLAKTAEQKLQMQGIPITVENIGKTVAAEVDIQKKNNNPGCIGSFLDILVALFKICLIGLGIIIGLPLLFALILVIIVLFATLFGVGTGLASSLFSITALTPFLVLNNPLLTAIAFAIVIGIPLIALIYSLISYFMKLKPVHKGVKWTGLIVWIAALLLFFFSGIHVKWRDLVTDWAPKFGYTMDADRTVLNGNGILEERKDTLSFITNIELDKIKAVELVMEQIEGDSAYISVNGDSNLLDHILLSNRKGDGALVISTTEGNILNPTTPFVIRLKTPYIAGVKMSSAGSVNFSGSFHLDELFINIEGAGEINADSLYINKINVKSEGVGSVVLLGKAKNATFDLEGAGEINASGLLCDSVSARVDGIGAIRSNPVEYLDGDVNGIGQITYKNEPKAKRTSISGIGKISLEN